jgi:hypothetical protein
VLRERPLERQRGALRKRGDVGGSDPGSQVVREAVRLVVRPGDDDDRAAGRYRRATGGEMAGPSGRRYAKDARIRQVRTEGVDEGCDATVTAAGGRHPPPW